MGISLRCYETIVFYVLFLFLLLGDVQERVYPEDIMKKLSFMFYILLLGDLQEWVFH
jgi:hypothetical protein